MGEAAKIDKSSMEAAESARARNAKQKEERERRKQEDLGLVEEAKKGDAEAFRKLVEHNQGRLFAVAIGILKNRDDAMDAVQDTFIKAHQKLSTFEGNAAFSTWLHRICVNRCIDKTRARKRRRTVDIDEVAPGALSGDSGIAANIDITPRLSGANPLRNRANQELAKALSEAIAQLSEEHRAVVILREVDGASYEEISQTLDIPKGTVMSRLFHARKKLQVILAPVWENAENNEDPGAL